MLCLVESSERRWGLGFEPVGLPTWVEPSRKHPLAYTLRLNLDCVFLGEYSMESHESGCGGRVRDLDLEGQGHLKVKGQFKVVCQKGHLLYDVTKSVFCSALPR